MMWTGSKRFDSGPRKMIMTILGEREDGIRKNRSFFLLPIKFD